MPIKFLTRSRELIHHKLSTVIPSSSLIDEAMTVQTWDDVLVVCKKLYDFIEQKKEEEKDDSQEMDIGIPGPESSNDDQVEEGDNPVSGDQPSEDDGEGWGEGDADGDRNEETDADQKELTEEGHETFTEENQRANEKDLLEHKTDRYDRDGQSQYSSGISDTNMEKITYSYAEVKQMRENLMYEVPETNYAGDSSYPYRSTPCREDWNDKRSTYKSQANLIAKDFERKKAAFEYSRATTAKSGKLDPLKMHSYKYSEDIFLTTTNLAQAKSHGIVMYLDLSGSMCDIIEDVVAQAITIAMFCRQVNVPFEAYSFTTTAYWREVGKGIKDMPIVESEVDSKFTKVVEMFSSKMNKKTFDEAAHVAFAIGKAHSMSRSIGYHLYSHEMHMLDMMGSTPLVQTCFLAAKQVKEFTRKHAIQNTNIMFLTDGQPDGVYVNTDEDADVITHRSHKIIKFGNKTIEGSSSRNLYEAALIRLKEITGATVMGFHLATDASSFGSGYHGVHESKDFSDVIKTWRKDNFSEWKDAKGYDNYFIIKINKSARFDTDEFTPRKADTIGDLKREFKKFNKTKKGNKQLVARITDAVAA